MVRPSKHKRPRREPVDLSPGDIELHLRCRRDERHKLGRIVVNRMSEQVTVLPHSRQTDSADVRLPAGARPLQLDPSRRLRWTCAKCVRAGVVHDELLRADRVLPLLRLMIDAHTWTLTVQLDQAAIEAAIDDQLQHAEARLGRTPPHTA